MAPSHFKGIWGPDTTTPVTCQFCIRSLGFGGADATPPGLLSGKHAGLCVLGASRPEPLSTGNWDLPSFVFLWGKLILVLTSSGLGNRPDPTRYPSRAYDQAMLNFIWRLRKTFALLCSGRWLTARTSSLLMTAKTHKGPPRLPMTRQDPDSKLPSLSCTWSVELPRWIPTDESGQGSGHQTLVKCLSQPHVPELWPPSAAPPSWGSALKQAGPRVKSPWPASSSFSPSSYSPTPTSCPSLSLSKETPFDSLCRCLRTWRAKFSPYCHSPLLPFAIVFLNKALFHYIQIWFLVDGFYSQRERYLGRAPAPSFSPSWNLCLLALEWGKS